MNLNLTLETLGKAIQGEHVQGNLKNPVEHISTDTRALKPGDFFLALKGENFDGHLFLEEALEKGAAGFIVEHVPTKLPEICAVLRVPSTLRALQDLAHFHRMRMNIPIVGITGSNGKTTTKQMLAQILRLAGSTCASEGNFNNHIGLPLSLLELQEEHQYGVFELGTNHPGEIATLASILKPTHGVITMIGKAHLEFLKTQEGVLEEKSALVRALDAHGTAILNYDDPFLRTLPHLLSCSIVWFGTHESARVRATNITHHTRTSFTLHLGDTSLSLTMPVFGKGNVLNALAAGAAAWSMGVSPAIIKQGLETFVPAAMRFQMIEHPTGALIINDAYNANPDSMRESLSSFAVSFPDRKKIAILGEMRELGDSHAEEHRELLKFLEGLPFVRIYALGTCYQEHASLLHTLGIGANITYVPDKQSLQRLLELEYMPDAALLFKASRGVGLEEVIGTR